MMKELLTEWHRYVLTEQEEGVPLPGEGGARTSAVSGQEGLGPTYAINQFFVDLSNNIFQKTGIRVLDPTGNKSPPKWAQKNPNLYALLQTGADLLASDPFTTATLFVPVGSLGSQATLALEKAGLTKIAEYGSRPISEFLINQAPGRIGEILKILNTTETKTVMKRYLDNLGKQNINTKYDVLRKAYSGAGGAENYIKAARNTIRQTVAGDLTKYAMIVNDSIVNKQMFVVFSEDAVRPVVVVETQYGKIPFYRSSGQSTPGVKMEGEWHMFGGMKPHSGGGVIYSKNKTSVNLTNGGNEYLTKISLALEEAWEKGLISQSSTRINLKSLASERLLEINKYVQRLNQQAGGEVYGYYTLNDLQDAYLNYYLNNTGAFQQGTMARNINSSNEFVGLKDVRVSVDKVLPKIF